MENWALRKSQTARIVGTSDPYRLREILAEARSHVARQRPGATMATWQSVGPDNVPGRIGALAISRQDSRVLYAGSAAGGVYKSTDGGDRWHALWSQQESLAVGGLAVAPSTDDVVYVATGEWEDNVSSTPYHLPGITLCAVEYAPADADWAYAASTLGRVWCSNDGGGTWHELPRGVTLAPARPVNDIEIDPGDPRRVFLAFGANDITFGSDTRAVWRLDVASVNQTVWTDVSGESPASSLPPRLPITGLAIDPRARDTLYAAHLLGVHRTVDGGGSWSPFDQGLPNCFVSDLDLHEPTRALYIATMGRGLYRLTL